jgi:hypothetical protein
MGRIVASALAGIAAFVSLFPFMGNDSDPPTHYSVFTWEVPTDELWLCSLAGITAATATWILWGLMEKRLRKDR